MEFTATMDIDFPEALNLIDEKQDLLDCLKNLIETMNARFPEPNLSIQN